MRKSIVFGALTLLGSAAATIVAVDTDHALPYAVELTNGLVARSEDPTSTSATMSTTTTWATVTSTLPPSPSTPPASTGYVLTESTMATISTTEKSPYLALLNNNIADDVTSTTTVSVIARPIVTTFTEAPAFFHYRPPNAPTDLTPYSSPTRSSKATYNPGIVTEYATSTAAMMTFTAMCTGPVPPPTTVTLLQTQTSVSSYAAPDPLFGVTIVDVTSSVTVTANSTGADTATTSWLNISTFVATGPLSMTDWSFGITSSTMSLSTSSAPISTTSNITRSMIFTTSSSSSPFVDNVGHKGATTVALHPQAPQNGAAEDTDLDGLLVAVAAAIGACVGLALML